MAATTVSQRNPKDSMKSTWRSEKSQWSIFHHIFDILDVHPSYLNQPPPVHAKTDKVPHLTNWMNQRQSLLHALVPLALHQAYCAYTKTNFSTLPAIAFYVTCFIICGIHQISTLRRLGQKYGYLDGDAHARDEVPDHSVGRVFFSLINTTFFRSTAALFLAYNSAKTPLDLSWKFILVELSLYGVILDFWFYWYHRVMHESDALWPIHRTHHLTKHPNPLLTLYADGLQEFFDIVGIPLMTYFTMKLMGLPMGFYEWWICHQYLVFTELSGHSGIRLYTSAPSPIYWLIQYFECDLTIEDHDLHHRRGWKKSGNYGKQTRLWDKVFGTCLDRIECTKANIAWEDKVEVPLF